MPVTEMEPERVEIEVIRRAVNLYVSNLRCWNNCVEKAIESVLLEFDFWLVRPLSK